MVEVIWTYRAYEDFKDLVEYIAKDSEHYGSSVKHSPQLKEPEQEIAFRTIKITITNLI